MSCYIWSDRKNPLLEVEMSLSDGPDGLLGCVELLKGEWIFSVWRGHILRVGGFSSTKEAAQGSVEKAFVYLDRLSKKVITQQSQVR